MNQKLILVSLVLIVVGALLAVIIYKQMGVQQESELLPEESQSQVSSLYSSSSNPLEKQPDLNPVNKANPFKEVKTNPFE